MDFKAATDRALETCITLEDLAAEVGVSAQTLRRARMDQSSEHSRSAPEGWEGSLATLARRRARELEELAEELEG